MKKEYDFSKGKRGAIEPIPANKKRITIRLDSEIIEWFRYQVETRGGGNYQTMINNALREYISNRGESLEKIIRKVVSEEIQKLSNMNVKVVYRSRDTAINKGIREDIPSLGFNHSVTTLPTVHTN
jgi:vacuolar-type H+-ATPase subunit E/Vma4